MQDQQFDDLAKRITEPVPRRVVVRAAVVTALGGLMSMARLGEAHAQGSTTCGSNRCVDLNNDPSNCGRCGNSCGFNGVCLRGQCTCPSGYVSCTTSAGLHKCIQCASGLVASNNCTTCACPSGTTQCGSTCADLQTCADHCGTCNHACARGQGCVNGVCTCSGNQQACPAGTTSPTGATCITCPQGQVATSVSGTCACACPTGTFLCNGSCVPNGANVCGNHCCNPNQQCSNGVCCGQNETGCNGKCCNSDSICSNGVCCGYGETGCNGKCCQSGYLCYYNHCVCQTMCNGVCCPSGEFCGTYYYNCQFHNGRYYHYYYCPSHRQVCGSIIYVTGYGTGYYNGCAYHPQCKPGGTPPQKGKHYKGKDRNNQSAAAARTWSQRGKGSGPAGINRI